jgi:flagellar hook-associated protein 3 FlgL
MTTRIGDFAHASRMNSLLAATQNRIREDQTSVASGKHVRVFADVADRASVLLAGKAEISLTENQIGENEHTVLRMRAMDGAIGQLGDLAERFRAMLVQRINAATGDALPLQSEIELMLKEVESQLNVQLDGRFLFAGSRTDTRPVSIPTPPPTSPADTSYYSGDQVQLSIRADEGVTVPYGITADDPAFGNLIAALGQAREAQLANDMTGLQSALGLMETTIDGLATLRSRLGSNTHRVETIADQQHQSLLYLDELVSGIEDTDLAAAVTRIAQDSATLEAAFLTISQMSKLSLADYLR